ncbi:hypothetical protein BDW74DRAFT_182809 [Aspergillus multicolor]|uniref:uncharacterized protein n=1 Tax=Aspergillus multicolor TaxID=41759 RepID=UPI003CCC9930
MTDSRGTRLVASCWSLAAAAGILLFLRVYCKLWRGRGLWWDDHMLIISWVALAIAVSLNTYIASIGFGSHIDTVSDENLKKINLDTILVAMFGIIATSTSKTSFAITLHRITTSAWMKYFLIFVIISINLSMNLVWIFGFAKCTPLERVWDKTVPGTCWDGKKLLKYQLFAAYYSAILDFVLALLPWQIIKGMSMLRRERIGVAVAMSLGAIAGATGIVKAVLVVHMSSNDITYDRVDLTIWTLAEPATSIMAISIPVLRTLYREIRSSGKSYPDTHTWTDGPRTGTRAQTQTHIGTDRRSRRNSKRAWSSVAPVMSNTGWQESQEALKEEQDPDRESIPSSTSPSTGHASASKGGGILKTEEFTVHHRPGGHAGEDPIELRALGGGRKGSR